jgi:hypothetical protein
VNYQVVYHVSASAKIPGLPAEAFTALVERLLQVADDPLAVSEPVRSEEPNFRHATFGRDDQGIVAFYVDRPRRVVTVYDLLWAG